MREYKKRLTTNNPNDYDPESDFCLNCMHFGDDCGYDKSNVCGNYLRFNKVYRRLSELEDLEEVLKCDLITLFKALKQGYIYVKLEDEITKRDVDMIDFREGIKGGCLDKSCYIQSFQTLKYINGYGKSWALTEKELEEE